MIINERGVVMRMRVQKFLATAAAAVILPIALAVPAEALPASCAFKPVYPARISIGQSVTSRSVGLSSNDPNCRSLSYSVSSYLVHGTDSTFETWDESSPTDSLTLYDFEIVPGTYITQGGSASAYDSSFNSVPSSFANAATVIKFAGRATVAATRNASNRVTLAATSRKWTPYYGYLTMPYKYVDFQRYVAATPTYPGHWATIRRASTNAHGAYSFYFYLAKRYSYRVVLEESSVAFSAASGYVYR